MEHDPHIPPEAKAFLREARGSSDRKRFRVIVVDLEEGEQLLAEDTDCVIGALLGKPAQARSFCYAKTDHKGLSDTAHGVISSIVTVFRKTPPAKELFFRDAHAIQQFLRNEIILQNEKEI